MKCLRLIDHNGYCRHIFDVFVEGPDFEYQFLEPVALWFGKIELVDKIPSEIPGVEEESTYEPLAPELEQEEGLYESETASAESSGDAGTSTPDKLEGFEVEVETRDGGDASKGSKRDRRAKKP